MFLSGSKCHLNAGKVFLRATFPFLGTRKPLNHTHRVRGRVLLTKLHPPGEWQSTNVTKRMLECVIFTCAFLVFCSGQTDLSGLHSGYFACWHSYFVTPLVSAILSATRTHKLKVCGSMVCEYWEKGRSRVRIFFQHLNEIWNPIKTSGELLICQITLMKFIWRSDQLNGIYHASSEGHRELLSSL